MKKAIEYIEEFEKERIDEQLGKRGQRTLSEKI